MGVFRRAGGIERWQSFWGGAQSTGTSIMGHEHFQHVLGSTGTHMHLLLAKDLIVGEADPSDLPEPETGVHQPPGGQGCSPSRCWVNKGHWGPDLDYSRPSTPLHCLGLKVESGLHVQGGHHSRSHRGCRESALTTPTGLGLPWRRGFRGPAEGSKAVKCKPPQPWMVHD